MHFLTPHKKEKIQKIQKIYSKENQKNNSSEKMIPEWLENDQKIIEKIQKYKDWNLTVYFLLMKVLLTKKIQFEKEKFKTKYLWIQLNFIKVLIECMEGLIARKINF